MKFIFKMFLLVGMIVVGKLYKEEAADASTVGKKENITTGDIYSLNSEAISPFTQPVHNVQDTEKVENQTEKTFTYSLN
ncbi:hypothetical protein [Rufibacter soli]|jgi:hypothetical protein